MATVKWYGTAINKMATKSINWTSDTIKVALVTSSYTPDQDTDATWSNVSANEVSGTGYTAGGKTLASKTLTYDASTNTWVFDAADAVWTGLTATFRYAVIYDTTATNALICYIDFGSNQVSTATDTTLKWEYSVQDPITGDITTAQGLLKAVVG